MDYVKISSKLEISRASDKMGNDTLIRVAVGKGNKCDVTAGPLIKAMKFLLMFARTAERRPVDFDSIGIGVSADVSLCLRRDSDDNTWRRTLAFMTCRGVSGLAPLEFLYRNVIKIAAAEDADLQSGLAFLIEDN